MKQHATRTALTLSLGLFLFTSCQKETPEETPAPPTITFAGGTGERKVKTGGNITLSASVENAVKPLYTWKIGGKIVSAEPAFTFVAERAGEYFAHFRVDAENGSAEGQIKISVTDRLPPQITLNPAAMAWAGVDKVFTAEAENAGNAACVWRLNGDIVSEAATYTFNQTKTGVHLLSLKVTTEDGQDLKVITVTVLPEPRPELFFDDGRYRTPGNAAALRKMTVPAGRSLVLAPVICHIENPATFEWKVNGATQPAAGEYFTFTPTEKGAYRITVTEKSTNATAEVEVTCTDAEGTYRRTGKAGRKAHAALALDYGPAPGQFIDYQTGSTRAKALQDLQQWCDAGAQSYFHIGAYGGYFILGFDHSVSNEPDKADLQIAGNPLGTWCEQGIVWVMQDDNGNGLPDDTWYELRGSETGKPETKQRLAMTYYRPGAPSSSVLWTDNSGRTGSVDWNGHHTQQYYYPMFITEDYYTLTGTCLASTAGIGGGLEVASCYDWGYVDNNSSSADRPASHFRIEDAIQADGSPVTLQYIDFVKVHTAAAGKGAATGEVSTEAFLPVDLNF
ncbi:MAG: hypothetical protein LBN98_03760 [Prevotellaceae bacterium]|jgi:hypothetical protein|nr:hypothetical protein [Prevotellaceae bacterium]